MYNVIVQTIRATLNWVHAMSNTPSSSLAWAKLERVPVGQTPRLRLSLVEHSADVAAVFEAILAVPTVSQRLRRLAGRKSWPAVWPARLCVHVALHDFGKANRGFQRQDGTNRGHVGPGLSLLYAEHPLAENLVAALSFTEMEPWGASEIAIRATAAHHGRPINVDGAISNCRHHLQVHWASGSDGYDPIGALAPLAMAVKNWFPRAFEPGGEKLPEEPAFWHAYAGLVMLADWIGSDTSSFPLRDPDEPPADRMAFAREIAPQVLRDYGFDPAPSRAALPRVSFASVSPHPPRDVQIAVAEAEGQIVVLEAETGSGKTEAALYRFAKLFEAGEVDGLYFALPTRVAAKSLYERVWKAVELVFPDKHCRPSVALAVPGYAKVDGATGRLLPGFEVQWDDDPTDAERRKRWAAERPKRFLAGTIAVGTIDQALLGAVCVKHAHMRSACLLRHLLVVDEVHSSDIYMESLLTNLLKQHTRAGGHALLLSATLGAAARQRLLGREEEVPDLDAAIAAQYPAVSSSTNPTPQKHDGCRRTKTVRLDLDPEIGNPAHVAGLALAAARRGAKVLVVRNLHRTAVATAKALFELAPDDPTLFRCKDVPTLHHGRFAREDRELLDAEIERQMQSDRGKKGLVMVGTQTLEQSLDICADLLITDLAPADVLLQRIGRLHRHPANDMSRPEGFEAPRAIVLSPADLTPLLERGNYGLGGNHGPYRDLLMLEETRRLIKGNSEWRIPDMNRRLVECVTHPDARERLTRELEQVNPSWRKNRQDLTGSDLADLTIARGVMLPWLKNFDDTYFDFGGPEDGKIGTRLGAQDLSVHLPPDTIGPFGEPVTRISIPHHWAGVINSNEDTTPQIVDHSSISFEFLVQASRFQYDHLGLARVLK